MEVIKLNVKKLSQLIDPFSFNPKDWGKKIISKSDVDRCLFHADLLSPDKKIKSRQDHIRRIAWYAAVGFGSSIKLKVSSPSVIEVEEGHHQLRAAIIRGDSTIRVTISGDPKDLKDLLI